MHVGTLVLMSRVYSESQRCFFLLPSRLMDSEDEADEGACTPYIMSNHSHPDKV